MTRSSSVPWLVMGPEPALATCRRCGEVYPVPHIPLNVRRLLALLTGMIARHRVCKEVTV